ncbi:MAG TPA: Asp-tRNA(Asn)/Glu-tRNA(Gln) amidotransferase subunit GatB [Syntrophorhabdus sp.]|jgi:aspartyl-tRNA(Asn)/glutamyl-tRNA(Gln) amidotransferase subunit B|nr:Asp-tRNA(Asn)/Glu-tRNA(Gln) amidotransferase subunit GatB [Syntrophorhabdus sp.]OPX99539.1 MAG: Aspartyl/glutamyl-tRNA(Asn/Gln) amidotransferase subunit B [Syntrophorhabdus sp. PtaB.Bin027]HOD78482.1 Asp-tRNA(Asn)/Glu-tRNA(Gln) amidotransferase subunit GatB [Syntrophorhabdus sp.]HQH83165.1 Asp-tRNA(Asn)/Glu-tRNA(Gln) amidotransferase subunit GatB [Syntrophorhabdus sp.]HQM25459.1 Asp-tRNA(Asn)/Glu-tRNA(Gln) amidotransferase subunit GatB [Syntrophorhabdus sp.]
MRYEAVIGLEIHVQLNTITKLFCDCPNSPGDEPNKNTCPTCLWLPGALPRLSADALEKATLACLALNCTIQPESAFDQKVYYYPDLPKGYQLSQHHKPLARNGWIDIIGEDGELKRLRIHHVHMEEDVARLVHETEGKTPISLVDFNRAGAPLIEIVSEPDLRSPHDAIEYVKALRTQLRYTGSAECSMEQGTLRVDANISMRPVGSDAFNTKVEVKNMNSIRNVAEAIAYEIKRQTESIEKGEPIVLHTRLWDPDKRVTLPMREKFSGPCVPDPSVPRIVVTPDWLDKIQMRLPEMPMQKANRFLKDYGLTPEEAAGMSQERDMSEFFEEVVRKGLPVRRVASWIVTHLMPALRDRNQTIRETTITTNRFAELLTMLESGVINAHAAKEVLLQLLSDDQSPEEIVEKGSLRQVSDTAELEGLIDKILADHPSDVEEYRQGNAKIMGFFMGLAMKASQGKANPKLLKEILTKRLG